MRLLLAGLLAAASAASAVPAQAGPCIPERWCAPCPYVLVLEPKPHLEQAQC